MMRLGFVVLCVLTISSCVVDDGASQAVPGGSTSLPSNGPDKSVALPFDNPFPNRWNPSNDGTSYEPCVAFSQEELQRFGVDDKFVEDAAQVDGQGIRGCIWYMRDTYSLSIVVTNAESLSQYKSGTPELDWKQDRLVNGRVVGLADLAYDDATCTTYIQSGRSIVATDVTISSAKEARDRYDPCKIVLDFTAAYIDKIPE